MSKLIKLFASVVATFICIVLLFEAYARFILKQPYYAFPDGYFVKNEFYGYELAKNFKGKYSQPEFTISIDTNSDGLRDVEHPERGNYKILALGDSFTFGVGVELSETYLSLLEKMLNSHESGNKYSIIKAGIIGYSTYNERVYLGGKGINYNPDIVMVQFWWDDLGVDHLAYSAEAGFLTTGRITNFSQVRLFLNKYFRSYAFLRSIFSRKFNRAIFANRTQNELENEESIKIKSGITSKEFYKIEAVCNERNVKVLFILIPPKEFVYDKIGTQKQWDIFCDIINKGGTEYIDLLPVLKSSVGHGQEPFFKIDPHLNATGHRLVAQEILKYL